MTGGRNKIRDYSVKKYDERKSRIEEYFNEEEYNKSRWYTPSHGNDSNTGGVDYELEKLTTYLLKSSDIESPRGLEYSFFIDERGFRNEYRYKKNNIKDKDRDSYSEDDYVVLSVLTDFGEPFYSNISNPDNDVLSNSDIIIETESDLVEILNLYPSIDYIMDIETSIYLKDAFYNVLEILKEECEDSLDEDIIKLLLTGMNLEEVHKKLNRANKTVRYRFTRLNDKLKLKLNKKD